jgi:hypothetical protein
VPLFLKRQYNATEPQVTLAEAGAKLRKKGLKQLPGRFAGLDPSEGFAVSTAPRAAGAGVNFIFLCAPPRCALHWRFSIQNLQLEPLGAWWSLRRACLGAAGARGAGGRLPPRDGRVPGGHQLREVRRQGDTSIHTEIGGRGFT